MPALCPDCTPRRGAQGASAHSTSFLLRHLATHDFDELMRDLYKQLERDSAATPELVAQEYLGALATGRCVRHANIEGFIRQGADAVRLAKYKAELNVTAWFAATCTPFSRADHKLLKPANPAPGGVAGAAVSSTTLARRLRHAIVPAYLDFLKKDAFKHCFGVRASQSCHAFRGRCWAVRHMSSQRCAPTQSLVDPPSLLPPVARCLQGSRLPSWLLLLLPARARAGVCVD